MFKAPDIIMNETVSNLLSMCEYLNNYKCT